MSAWPTISLSEIAQKVDYGVTASATQDSSGPKFLRITDIQEGGVNWNDVPWCECDERALSRSLLQTGDIVFARTGATTGKSYLIRECPDKAVFASYLIRVRLNEKADPAYLIHFFSTPYYWAQISSGARGAAQLGVNATTLQALKIPILALSEQKRIAAILDQAELIQNKRRAAVGLLDDLAHSIFNDMFGDPISNPYGFQEITLGDVIYKATDGPHVSPVYVEQGIPFLSTRHIRKGVVDWGDMKFISIFRC